MDRRDEDIHNFAKDEKSRTIHKVFTQQKSVFYPWKVDDKSKYEQMADLEFSCWKVGPKMIKDANDCKNVEKVIRTHYEFLKTVFIYLASRSQYPAIT